jgi:hypothetical protein
MSETRSNLPVVSADGDVALAGDVNGAAIEHPVERLMSSLHHHAEAFDDVHLNLNIERHPNGASSTNFSYRCYKHRR